MRSDQELWDDESKVSSHGVEVPCWVEDDIAVSTLMGIDQGGCASGAYMPAVTYHQALATMNEHGDEVCTYLEEFAGEMPVADPVELWSGLAVYFLANAVEVWAMTALGELREMEPAE